MHYLNIHRMWPKEKSLGISITGEHWAPVCVTPKHRWQIEDGTPLSWLFFFSNQGKSGKITLLLPLNQSDKYILGLNLVLPENIHLFDHGFLAHNKFLCVLILTTIIDHFLKNYDPLTQYRQLQLNSFC